ncbi:MAG: ATP-binding protein [Liquorilactobacillus hordei]|uniref:ATP-binding protein n=1 Tax=Liquorilactobacillus hordei TaxID=468911 RepID=UPI0039ECE63E
MQNLKKPFKTILKNMLLTNTGQVWAYYRIPSRTISENNAEEIESYKRTLVQMLWELKTYYEIDLQLLPEDMRLNERFKQLEKDFSSETGKIGERYDERTMYVLGQELGEVTRYGFTVGVKLHNTAYLRQDTLKESFKTAFDSVTMQALSYLGLSVADTKKAFEPYEVSEKEVFDGLSVLKGERLTDKQLYRNTTEPFRRGIAGAEVPANLQTTNTTIDPVTHTGFLRLTNEYGESCIALMPITNTEVNMTYAEIFRVVQKMPFPVEFKVKALQMKPSSAVRKTQFTARRFKETDKDMYANEDSDSIILQGKPLLNDLRNDIENKKTPFYKWLGVFVVSGKDKTQCQNRCNALKSYMANYHVELTRPLADQINLFYTLLNGNSIQFERYWLQYTKDSGIAELLFGLTSNLGSNIGFYLGRVTHGTAPDTNTAIQNSRDIVLYHPMIANEGIVGAMTDSPHCLISGETGKGKSFLAKLLMFYMTFLDVQILMTDPKNENHAWFEEAVKDPEIQKDYPYFIDLMKTFHYVTLDPNDKNNYGVLDPLSFLNGAQAKDTAVALIEQVYNLKGKDDVKREILEDLDMLIERKQKGEKVGLMDLIEMLKTSKVKNIAEAGGLIGQLVKNSILQLAFSDGTSRGLNIDYKHTILSIQGLDLPEAGTKFEEMNDSDRKALAVMIPLAKFCQYFGQRDRKQKTSIIFDEAWTLTATRGGKRLVKELRRAGRSYNNQLIMITQSVKDAQSEDDRGNFGACFAFDERSEREDILKFMDLPVTKENKELLADMKKGQCLFRDFYGRVDALSVDCVFPEWLRAFKTVDKSHSAKAEREFV